MTVKRQTEGALTKGPGAAVLKVLAKRKGQPTIVRLVSGTELFVYDVAWGRDIGDYWEHVTTNCSPPVPERNVDFFYMSEVAAVLDPDTRAILIEQTPHPDLA